MNFKDQLDKDLDLFFNLNEFADKTYVYYNREQYNIPVVLDYETAEDRKKLSNDNVEGIFSVDAKMHVAFRDIKTLPRQGTRIEVGEDVFKISKVANNKSVIILNLERLDE